MMKKILLSVLLVSGICFGQLDEGNKFMLAQSYMQAAQFEKARPILEDLHNHQPGNYEYFQTLNSVYIQLKNYDASIALIEDRINISSPDINLYGLLGSTYYLKGDEIKAFGTWDNALQKFPPNEAFYRIIANYAIERRTFDKAIQYLKKGQEISSNPVYFAFDLANLYTATMQYGEATEEYCIILSKNDDQYNLIENKIFGYISKPGALQASIPVLEKYSNSNKFNFKLLLAKLYIENKSYDKAFDVYKDLDNLQNSKGGQLVNFAQILYSNKAYKMASKIYETVLSEYPSSPIISVAKLGYAKTLEKIYDEENSYDIPSWKPFYKAENNNAAGEEKIISAYREIIKIYPRSETANEALLRIGEIYLNQNNLHESESNLQNLVTDSPSSAYALDAYLDLAKIAIIKNDLDGAAAYYEKIASLKNASADKRNFADYRLARVYFFKCDFEKTKEYLGGILNNLGNNSANDALLLSLLMNTSANDSSNLVIFAQAELLAEQGNFKEAAIKYSAVASEPQKLMLQNLADLRIAEMDAAENNLDNAASKINEIVNDAGKNIYADKALYLLGKIFQYGIKNKPKAVETYENLLAKFPNSLYLDDARAEIIKLNDKSLDNVK